MVEREPEIFKNWDPYMKVRQIMGSAVIFKNHGWTDWQGGHAKLFGILLRDFETKKRWKFKYNTDLKKRGYRRTHNYRLLHKLIKNNLLQKEGNGYYSFNLNQLKLIKGVVLALREMDGFGNGNAPTKVVEKSESIAL